MVNNTEVVITGVGMVSPIGTGREAFWDSLRTGRSGVGPLSFAAGTDLPVKFGSEIEGFDPKQFVKPRKSLKLMCREMETGHSAAVLAIQDANLNRGDVDPDRYGIVLGAEMFYCELQELADAYRKCVVNGQLLPELWGEGAMSDLNPLWMLKQLPNMVACHVAIAEDARGPNNTITLDEVSCLLALIESVCVIQRGHADVMITGGCGTRINLTRIMYRGDGAWSHRNDDPQGACRPFDADRDGGVIGEGAGAFVLESREHAEARGANIIARVLGYGSSFGAPATQRDRSVAGIRRSINSALRSAQLTAADVGHVNANGSSVVIPDQIEAQAIHDCLGDTPVTAPRSYFGCLGAGSGAVEMMGSVLAISKGEIPATLNYQHPDPMCPINVIRDEPLRMTSSTSVILNQSEAGQAVAVVIAGP